MLIRTNLGISKRAGTARVDLGRARPPIAGFCADLTIPGEIVNFANFHTSETPKIRLFQFSSILSRHGPCGIATELSKACKIRFFFWSVQFHIQLRRTRGHPPSEITQIGKFNHDRMNERDQKDSKQDRQGPKASKFGADRRQ